MTSYSMIVFYYMINIAVCQMLLIHEAYLITCSLVYLLFGTQKIQNSIPLQLCGHGIRPGLMTP